MPPVVPLYDTPQVQPAGMPNVQIQGLSPRQLAQAEDQGEQQKQLGQNIQNAGVKGMEMEAQQNMLANQSRVDTAVNNVQQKMQDLSYGTQASPDSGYLAQKGPDAIRLNGQGQGLTQSYGAQLDDAINSEASNLSNPAQQQVFAREAMKLSTMFRGQIDSHVLQQHQETMLSGWKGTYMQAENAAKTSWFDPKALSDDPADKSNSPLLYQIQRAESAVINSGMAQGHAAVQNNADAFNAVSNIHAQVIMSALQNTNPAYAQQYLSKFQSQMNSKDLADVGVQLHKEQVGQQVTSAGQAVADKFAPQVQPTSLDRMTQITQQSESGGNANAVGPNVPGQGTAKGAMQVMDATAANPGHGIQPENPAITGDRDRVGRQLLGALLQKFGDPGKAWAAYNAGEGNMDKAVKDAGPGGDWMAALANYQSPENHAQTQAYVQKNVSQLSGGGGTPPIPTQADFDREMRAQIGPNASPDVIKAADAESKRQYLEAMNTRKVNGENSVNQVMTYLVQNKGNYNSIPPDMMASVVQNAPDKIPTLQKYAQDVANPRQGDNMTAYHTAIEHPDELAKMPDSQFNQFAMANFSEATQKQIAKLRQDELSGTSDQSSGGLNARAMTAELNNRLQSMQLLDATGKPKDKDQVGTITKQITDGIFAQQQQLGRKMSAQEISQYIDRQFLTNQHLQQTFWSGEKDVPLMAMTYSDLNSSDVSRIQKIMATGAPSRGIPGIPSPTHDQILRYFWNEKNANN